MFELMGVSKRYGDKLVLRDVDLRLEAGLTYGLIGVNGAGKTTFLKIAKRLIREHGGRVFLRDSDITDKDANDVSVSYVCDTPAFFSDLLMKEQMLLICRTHGLAKNDALARVGYYAEKLGLNPYLDYYPHALSRGTQQRFNVALSFLTDVDLYLYDEPFITLDPVQVGNLEDVFAERRGQGFTQVISSHNLESLERICDAYLVLNQGVVELFLQQDADKDRIMRCLNASARGIC
ncbi:MAG: ABC transporter ATP-binding protein [Slackia sp.]|nr:ABC transporter ATP-binding protein [Slackia sp.]